MKTLKLPPSNWWTPQSYTKAKALNFNEFCERGAAEIKKYPVKDGLKVEKAELVMDLQAFNRAADACASIYGEGRSTTIAPLLSFHATTSAEVVQRIIKHGFRSAADFDPEGANGLTIGMQHGNLFGDGIYSSASLTHAASYCYLNRGCTNYVLLNLVIPGAVKFFDYQCSYDKLTPSASTQKYQNIVEHNLATKKQTILKESFETLAENGLGRIITGSNDLIIPFYLLTVSFPMYVSPVYTNGLAIKEAKEMEADSVELCRLFGHYYTIKANRKEIHSKYFKKREYLPNFFVTVDWLKRKELREKLQSILASVTGKVLLFVLQNGVSFNLIKWEGNAINLKSIADSLSFDDAKATFDCANFAKIFDRIACEHSDLVNDGHSSLFLPMFLCLGNQLVNAEDGINSLTSSQEVIRLRALSTSFLLLRPSELSLPSFNPFFLLKWLVTEGSDQSFQRLYEDSCTYVQSGTFPIEKQVIRDLKEFASRDVMHLELLPFHSTLATGFVNDFEMGITHSASFSSGALVHFKDKITVLQGHSRQELFLCKYSEETDWPTVFDVLSRLLQGYVSEMNRAGINYFLSRKMVIEFIDSLSALAMGRIEELSQQASPNIELIKVIKRTLYLAAQVAAQMKALHLFNPNIQGFEWYKRLLGLKFSKDIARRVTGQGNEELNEEAADNVLLDPSIQLPALMVRISGASQIEPWLLIVERVRLDESVAVRSVYLRNEGLAESKGPNGYFLMPTDGSNVSDSEKILLSYLFTGSPFLYLPSQPSALVSILWARALEELLIAFRRRKFDRERLIFIAGRALELTEMVGKARFPSGIVKLLEEARVEDKDWQVAIVSEKQGVFSLCIALVALAQNAHLLQSETFYKTVAMCLLQESVARSAKAYSRSQGSKFSRTDHLASVLGISADGKDWTLDVMKCVERTRNFFKLRNTNCTPFAVVAVLGFLASGCRDAGALFGLYENSTISMKTFIKSINAQVDPLKVQLALFLNAFLWDQDGAIDYCSAFNDPQQAIDAHVSSIMNTFKRRADADKQRQTISRERFLSKLRTFEDHAKCHEGDPVMFRQSQIAELNQSRPLDNQLELADGFNEFGLLKYHCCYPKCPDFLGRSFQNGSNKSRKFLFKHLDPDQKFYINFVPSYHLILCSIIARDEPSGAEEFCKLLRKAIKKDKRMTGWFEKCPAVNVSDAGIQALFEQYRSLYQ